MCNEKQKLYKNIQYSSKGEPESYLDDFYLTSYSQFLLDILPDIMQASHRWRAKSCEPITKTVHLRRGKIDAIDILSDIVRGGWTFRNASRAPDIDIDFPFFFQRSFFLSHKFRARLPSARHLRHSLARMHVSAFPFRRVTAKDVTIPSYVSYFRAVLNEPCRPACAWPTSLPSKQVEQTSACCFSPKVRVVRHPRYTREYVWRNLLRKRYFN